MDVIKNIVMSVIMVTYNHENYIIQAIESVLMQHCNFDVELIIANDASTDKTDKLIKEYLKKLNKKENFTINYTCHPQNKGMFANTLWALSQCDRKYIAFCDGDDYWTDAYKLQKQVDFLDENEDYLICSTNYSVLQSNGIMQQRNYGLENREITLEMHLLNNQFSTQTICFRNSILEKIDLIALVDYQVVDWPLTLYILKHGKGMVLGDNTAVYRNDQDGVFSSLNKPQKNKIRLLTIAKFIEQNSIVMNHLLNNKLKKDIWDVLFQTINIEERIIFLEKTLYLVSKNSIKNRLIKICAKTPHSIFSRIGWRLL